MKLISLSIEVLFQISFLMVLTVGGNELSRYLFWKLNEKRENDENKLGRVVGTLERLLIFAAVCSSQWALVPGVIALKTIARFKQLEEKEFAEYFLIGSMFSILYCLVLSYAYINYVGFFSTSRSLFIMELIKV